MIESYEIDIETPAFVGISFSNKVIYNIVDTEGEFFNTGMSIVSFLKHNKNKFMAKVIESQSYNSIKVLLDDSVVFGEFYDTQNTNIESFQSVYNIMNNEGSFEYFYIYDIIEDLLFVKVPEFDEVVAIDYKNSNDVRKFINNLKQEEY